MRSRNARNRQPIDRRGSGCGDDCCAVFSGARRCRETADSTRGNRPRRRSGVNALSVPIGGGDFEHGGEASRRLKALLQRSGADPSAVRRAVIATYEAEMNVIIHARCGRMDAAIDADRITVEISDEGPGIPDVSRALTEGWSTAPEKARQLGFGAGLGLPNIRRMSDTFQLDTRIGQGTRLRFAIRVSPTSPEGYFRHHLRLRAERCTSCMACVIACPTTAMRVRDGSPSVLAHLCVDCAECVRACRPKAIEVEVGEPVAADGRIAVLPAELRTQFGRCAEHCGIDDAVSSSFAARAMWTDGWTETLRDAEREAASENAPVISAQCSAIADLVATRFPSLVANLSPFRSPIEAAAFEAGAGSLVAVMCPAQRAAAQNADPTGLIACVAIDEVIRKVRPAMPKAGNAGEDGEAGTDRGRDGVFVAWGARHVLEILDRLEDGRLDPCRVLELYLCDGGCRGSPLLAENPWISSRRASRRPNGDISNDAKAVRRESPVAPRAALRLDPDMAVAMRKFAEIDRTTKILPGRDCAQCGAPDCSTYAEDIVLGRAPAGQCPYREVKS
ncbi:MAG: ATP-binding protein [Deltaproteobacteria bacterium]|nr:ATP-binding protein [Deltaproteobacteria bacterium]